MAQVLGDKEAAKRVADAIELVALARCGGHNSVTVFYSQTDAVIRPGMWVEGSHRRAL